MSIILLITLWLIVLWAAFYAVYWHLFRPAVLAKLRFRLYHIRDDMRNLVISEKISENDEGYLILERSCKNALSGLPHLNLIDLLLYRPTQDQLLKAKQEWQILSANENLRKIRRDVLNIIMGAVFLNSPGLFPLLALTGFLLVAFYWFNAIQRFVFEKTIEAWSLNLHPIKC